MLNIPQSSHFCRLSPSSRKKKKAPKPLKLLSWPVSKNQRSVQGSGLSHLLMGIKHVSLEMQVNADRLGLSFGLLFGCRLAFAAAFPLLLGGGQQLLGLRAKTL